MWCVNTSYCLQLSTAQTPFRSWPTGWITIHNSSCKFEQRFAGNFADCVVVDSKLPDQVAFGPSTIYTSSFITKPNLAQHIEARAGEKKPRDRRRSVGFWTDQTRPSGYVNPVGSEVASLTMHVNKTNWTDGPNYLGARVLCVADRIVLVWLEHSIRHKKGEIGCCPSKISKLLNTNTVSSFLYRFFFFSLPRGFFSSCFALQIAKPRFI